MVEKWRFYRLPTVWVEGPTDVVFYEPISDGIACRFEAFRGRSNADSLIRALKDYGYPYVVILDGDYAILKRSRAPHRWVLVLPRYSFENLLWESEAVNKACLRHAQCGEDKDLVSPDMAEVERMIEQDLLCAIILDVAARRFSSPPEVLPNHIEPILRRPDRTEVDPDKITERTERAKNQIDHHIRQGARASVADFLTERRITDLLRGHLLFGLLRRIFTNAAARERGNRINLHDSALTQMLSDAIWRYCKTGDHQRLRGAFRSKLRGVTAERARLRLARGDSN